MKTTYIISTLFLSVLIWACDLMGDVDLRLPSGHMPKSIQREIR